MPKYIELSAKVELNTKELLGDKHKAPEQEDKQNTNYDIHTE